MTGILAKDSGMILKSFCIFSAPSSKSHSCTLSKQAPGAGIRWHMERAEGDNCGSFYSLGQTISGEKEEMIMDPGDTCIPPYLQGRVRREYTRCLVFKNWKIAELLCAKSAPSLRLGLLIHRDRDFWNFPVSTGCFYCQTQWVVKENLYHS